MIRRVVVLGISAVPHHGKRMKLFLGIAYTIFLSHHRKTFPNIYFPISPDEFRIFIYVFHLKPLHTKKIHSFHKIHSSAGGRLSQSIPNHKNLSVIFCPKQIQFKSSIRSYATCWYEEGGGVKSIRPLKRHFWLLSYKLGHNLWMLNLINYRFGSHKGWQMICLLLCLGMDTSKKYIIFDVLPRSFSYTQT